MLSACGPAMSRLSPHSLLLCYKCFVTQQTTTDHCATVGHQVVHQTTLQQPCTTPYAAGLVHMIDASPSASCPTCIALCCVARREIVISGTTRWDQLGLARTWKRLPSKCNIVIDYELLQLVCYAVCAKHVMSILTVNFLLHLQPILVFHSIFLMDIVVVVVVLNITIHLSFLPHA